MRLIALLLLVTLSYATQFPQTFSSAGDELFQNMQRYEKIKALDIYKNRPEMLESYCIDANASMQKGFALDKMKEDPEAVIDKGMIKAYAKELRVLAKQNEKIMSELNTDVENLYNKGDFTSLKKIEDAGFTLSRKMRKAVKEYEQTHQKQNEVIAVTPTLDKQKQQPEIPLKTNSAVQKPLIQKTVPVEIKPKESLEIPVVVKKKPTELEYYMMSLKNLKSELYALREGRDNNLSEGSASGSSSDEKKMACLNDITAINYWMIKVLQSKQDMCMLRDGIKQMKAYDKASASSCGRGSLRYVEWHGRIKPYVGKKLFEAEAGCHN